jgi:hypothetical protein
MKGWFREGDWTALGFIAVCLVIFGPVVWSWLWG